MQRFLTAIMFGATILIFTACGGNDSAGQNYSATVAESYRTISALKGNLIQAAENLSVSDATGTEKFNQTLDAAKSKLAMENSNLTDSDVPEKFSDANKKILDCLKIEYNLIDRLKEILANTNEYDAAENLPKIKESITNLKEQSALLTVDGNDFEDAFELSAVYEKLDRYINAKKQMRYDKDTAEQAKRDAEAAQAAANRERSQRQQGGGYEREIGVYPATGLTAYLLMDSISRYSDGFSCTVVCYPSGKPYYINYTFSESYDGFHFTNSDGYGGRVTSYDTPVEYNVWNYVW